jgi:CheY-like chemotaxis protein
MLGGMPVRQDIFAHHVRDALTHLYDPVHLQAHPLVSVLALPRAPGKSSGEALRELLWMTIESLRPMETVPVGRPEWLSYRLLWLFYVQSVSQEEACQELGLCQRSFYRRLAEALDAVTSLLWERHEQVHTVHPDEGVDQGPLSPIQQAKEEAIKVARESQRQAIDLSELLASATEIVQPLAAQQGIVLRINVPPGLPPSYGDPAMVHQIMLNVLTEGLRLAAGDSLELTVSVRDGETFWRLGALDECKAPEHDLAQVSGLAVSQGLLEVYEGRLWFESDEQGAGWLQFTMPAARARSILIIDDDADTIGLYRRHLEVHGYAVRAARSSEQVETQIAESCPDLILLDVLMPRQDGWKMLQRLKTMPETAAIPVVICSVLSQPSLALVLGAEEVLQKPIDEGDLLTTVQRVLAQAGSVR